MGTLKTPPLARVMFSSTRIAVGMSSEHWPLVHLFNPEVIALQTGTASEGTNLSTCRYRSPIGDCSPLAGSGQVSLSNSLS